MKLIKKILTILILLFNLTVRRRHYKLKFISEETDMGKLWYYHFPLWGFDKHNLLMVSGADKLCEYYSEDGKTATVEIVASKKDLHYGCKYDHYIGMEMMESFDKFLYGRRYAKYQSILIPEHRVTNTTFWICPVTLFVLGRYPNHLYILSKDDYQHNQ
jgi:hypothetical protein